MKKSDLVSCDAGETIGKRLAGADRSAPTTIGISGTCRQSLLVAGFDDLRLVGPVAAAIGRRLTRANGGHSFARSCPSPAAPSSSPGPPSS